MLPDVGSTIVPPGFSKPVAFGRVDHRDRDAVLDAAARIRRLELGDQRAPHAFGAARRGAGERAECARQVEDRVGRVDRRQRVGHTPTLPLCSAICTPRIERVEEREVQRHEYSIELDAPPADVWEVFWYRAPDRPQPKDVKTRIEILHPGDDDGNGLVRHCYFPVRSGSSRAASGSRGNGSPR